MNYHLVLSISCVEYNREIDKIITKAQGPEKNMVALKIWQGKTKQINIQTIKSKYQFKLYIINITC